MDEPGTLRRRSRLPGQRARQHDAAAIHGAFSSTKRREDADAGEAGEGGEGDQEKDGEEYVDAVAGSAGCEAESAGTVVVQ